MPQFNNLKSLFKHIEKETQKTLKESKNVKSAVQKAGSESVHERVYKEYTPSPTTPYQRKMDSGGLSDPKNFSFIYTNDGFEVHNVRKDRGVDIARIVHTGEGYSIPDVWGYSYEKPRRFFPYMKEILETKYNIKNILREELKKKGFDVR